MITRIKNGNVLIDGVFQKVDLFLDGKTIVSIGTDMPFDRDIDAGGNYVSAGFIDLHCHGGGGADFSDGDREGVIRAAKTHLQHGTTALFPTALSADFAMLEKAIIAIEEAQQSLPMLVGIHLEGPYFSPSQTGAQNGKALRLPLPEEYHTILANHKIARWDYAPELDTDFCFLKALQSAGAVPSAAHTDATCEEMEAAAAQGCRLITHLYSCTSTIRREAGFRIAGVVEAAYLTDEICAELIADGCHLPHSLLRLAYKLKGPDRLVLVTDAMRAAGLEQTGAFDIGGVPCIVEDGVAKLLDRTAFAGSVATADRLVRTCQAAGIPLADCVKMITQTPARIMGLSHKGRIAVGYDADIVIFDADITIKNVFLQGEQVV